MKKTKNTVSEYLDPGPCPANMSRLDYLVAWRSAVQQLVAIDANNLAGYLNQEYPPYALVVQIAKLVGDGVVALAEVNRQVEAEVDLLSEESKDARNEFDIIMAEVNGD